MTAPLLALQGVSKHYAAKPSLLGRLLPNQPVVRAVQQVTLDIAPGEILGLVGESGSGKSTLGRVALHLEPPTEGQVLFQGRPPAEDLAGFRRRAQMVFQDPQSSLNRSLTIERILDSPLSVHRYGPAAARRARIVELLELVGLRADMMRRYPHELSGGQRQRVGIARALAIEPAFLVLDEPTSALDVSIQAQVVNLLVELQQRLSLTYLFISHDLRLVRWLCDRIAVMYLGRIVEVGPAAQLWEAPAHPYTRALLAAVTAETLAPPEAAGEVPSPIRPPPGCAFHPRCPAAGPRCAAEAPRALAQPLGAMVACHLHDGGVG
ncbi:ABC transporter ATP-binding protein [Falsiroseomonas selenitidurans]|uniref:ABC transporter ATP-binding protein n=1 Tax=Falsiroseomonas selenitidurans TaxID=2716335 RepID=A0ABX1E7B8_9PROT|nr:ABC transporter ATP-binding protein [Falsiroseomonas selenitidurans]NKC30820.1 ABC transporter ATP-binding protein [Falsiroseomonas selenitidurans]